MTFAWQDDPSNILCSAQTDVTGLASCTIFPSQPILAGRTYVATFPGTTSDVPIYGQPGSEVCCAVRCGAVQRS
jgi:hypothetical protein